MAERPTADIYHFPAALYMRCFSVWFGLIFASNAVLWLLKMFICVHLRKWTLWENITHYLVLASRFNGSLFSLFLLMRSHFIVLAACFLCVHSSVVVGVCGAQNMAKCLFRLHAYVVLNVFLALCKLNIIYDWVIPNRIEICRTFERSNNKHRQQQLQQQSSTLHFLSLSFSSFAFFSFLFIHFHFAVKWFSCTCQMRDNCDIVNLTVLLKFNVIATTTVFQSLLVLCDLKMYIFCGRTVCIAFITLLLLVQFQLSSSVVYFMEEEEEEEKTTERDEYNVSYVILLLYCGVYSIVQCRCRLALKWINCAGAQYEREGKQCMKMET